MNFSTQEKIDKEMNDLAKSMASSQDWTVGELVKTLGRDGVKKAMENMSEEQLVSFKEELKKHVSSVPDSKLDSCVEDVTPKQGEQAAYAICTHQLEKSKCEKCMTKSDSNPDGLSGAMLGIAEAPKETEKTEQKKKEEKDMLEEVKKSENIVSGAETATDRGGKFFMNNDPEDRQTILDEMIAMDMAASEEMRTIGHQGGPEKDGAWEGQVIGEEPKTVSENQPEPKSENKDNNIADNIVEINALGKLSKPERDAMREKIIAFIEAMMERKIEKSVGLDILSAKVGVPSVKLHTIYDAIELQKSGEGSRGGKIIGHAKSGKPIYEHADHPSHAAFSKEDHADASRLHNVLSAKEFSDKNANPGKEFNTHIENGSKHASKWAAMKKSDSMYHNDETHGTECYIAKSEHNPFSHRNIGHNCHYGVDSYIEQEEAAIQANLAKSTFFSPEAKHETTKPSVQNLIEKGLDMDDSSFNTAIVNQSSKVEPKGVVFVKSFADEVMDAFFQETDSWGQPLKKSEETK